MLILSQVLTRLPIDVVRDCITLKEILGKLDALPAGLHCLYAEAMKRIRALPDSQADLAIRALVWTTLSLRPLTVKELPWAVSDSVDPTDAVNTEVLLSLCCGLLEVEAESNTVRLIRTLYSHFHLGLKVLTRRMLQTTPHILF